jgi:hypothetical protein
VRCGFLVSSKSTPWRRRIGTLRDALRLVSRRHQRGDYAGIQICQYRVVGLGKTPHFKNGRSRRERYFKQCRSSLSTLNALESLQFDNPFDPVHRLRPKVLLAHSNGSFAQSIGLLHPTYMYPFFLHVPRNTSLTEYADTI